MTQISRTRMKIGAASLLVMALWQAGAAPTGLAQVMTSEPNLVAPPPGVNPPKAEEAPVSSLTTTAIASVCSVMLSAARCRVPNRSPW